MPAHIFKSLVHHDKNKFKKGMKCPDELVDSMLKKGLVEPLPQVVPVEADPVPAVIDPKKK